MSKSKRKPAADAPAPVEHQFKVKVSDEVLLRLFHQAEELGFLTENALAAVALSAFAKVPARKVWQVLALIESYEQGVTGRRQLRRDAR